MAVPTPMFAGEDWLVVWLWPTIMAIAFSVFMRRRDDDETRNSRSIGHRLMANFVLFASVWVPFQIFGDAVERGAEVQGFAWPVAWGFGMGLVAMIVTFASLLIVAIRTEPARNWLGLNRGPFKGAGRA